MDTSEKTQWKWQNVWLNIPASEREYNSYVTRRIVIIFVLCFSFSFALTAESLFEVKPITIVEVEINGSKATSKAFFLLALSLSFAFWFRSAVENDGMSIWDVYCVHILFCNGLKFE